MERLKMLIGVLSCHRYVSRREACLETWADVQHRPGVELVFVLGGGPTSRPVRDGCLLHCPCPDDSDSLSLKTLWLWAIANYRFDFLGLVRGLAGLEGLDRCGDPVAVGFAIQLQLRATPG